MSDQIIFNAISSPQKSNPFRLYPGDTLSVRTTGTITSEIFSNPFTPYSITNDTSVQLLSTSSDLVAPSECVLILDVTALSGTVSAIIIRSKYANE